MRINLLHLFINPFLSNEYTPVKYEITKNITYTLPKNQMEIVNKINGFYGQIGPNPRYYDDDYHLFDGDGMIHGIFFNNGKLTYCNHWIRTDKFNYENKIGTKLPISVGTIHKKEIILLSFVYKFLEFLHIMPNFMGLANTALWNNNGKIYALHERDMPYEIDIDFKYNTINTIKKMNLQNIKYFTAHPKIDKNNCDIYVASYDIMLPKLKLLKYDKNMNLIKHKIIDTKYKNMIHDIVVTDNYIIFCDTPYEFNVTILLSGTGNSPFYFDNSKKNRFYIVSKDLETSYYIELDESFFIFHYGDYHETDDNIYFTAIIRNNFDMNIFSKKSDSVNYSKYRRFIICKKTKKIIIERNKEFEKYDVDFPIFNKNNKIVILSVIKNPFDIVGFLVAKDFKLIRTHMLRDRKIFAEPSIIIVDNITYIVCFTFDEKLNNYLYIYDYVKNDHIEIKLDIKISKGFHSIFIKN
jgi:carotenoid cleavage dioxygenase-like enzyme